MRESIPTEASDYLSKEKLIKRELDRFNWGAFMFTWIWGIFNGVFDKVVLMPLVLLLWVISVQHASRFFSTYLFAGVVTLAIYYGLKGNHWAYMAKNYTNFSKFVKIQRYWAKASLVLIVAALLFVGAAIKHYKSVKELYIGELMLRIVTRIMFENKNYNSLKNGSDVATYVLKYRQEGSKKKPASVNVLCSCNFEPPSSIRCERLTNKGKFIIVISFYKEELCSISEKNCYISYYQVRKLGDEKPELLAKVYFGDDKKVKYFNINDIKIFKQSS